MSLRFTNFPLLAPIDATSGSGGVTPPGGSSGGMGKEDIIKFLGDEETGDKETIPLDDKKDKKGDKEDERPDKSDKKDDKDDEETPEDEETDDLEDLVDDLVEPDDEKLALVTPVRRKEILAKYPKIFKDFPYLETAYYREQQFTKYFPTMDDAKSAAEAVETMGNFENDLKIGNTETIIASVKQANPKAFNKLVDNYLPTLAKIDSKAYGHVIGNVIKHTIHSMVTEGRRANNKQLEAAASLLNQFVFMTSEYTPPSNLSDGKDDVPDEQETKISERETRFLEQQIKAAQGDLDTRVNNIYKSTIEANIDPKESMSDYVRRQATRDALESLSDAIDKDSRFKIIVDKLWAYAKSKDFDKPSLDRIKSAYVSKARTLLPSVIKKARNEALKGMGKRVTDDKDDEVIRKPTRSSESSRSHSRDRNDTGSKGGVPKGMSTLEFLMSDD